MASLPDYISYSSNYFSIPNDLLTAQLQQESSMGTNMGSIGNIGQVTPDALTDVDNAFGYNFTPSDIANDNGLGAFAAAGYDKLMLDKTGSYEGMLESYGTIPSSPFDRTNSQEQLAQMAQNLDLFGSTQAGNPVTNPNAPLSSIASAATNSSLASFLSFITSGQGWERIGVIVIGIVLIGIAGFMLATKGFEGTIKTVASGV